MSAGNGSATADPAQRKKDAQVTSNSSALRLIMLPESWQRSPSAGCQRGSPAGLRRGAVVAGAGGQAAVLPGTRAAAGSAGADGRVVTAGIHPPPCLTFPLDFSERIFGYKQFLWAARSEAGSHLLCKCYT